MATAVDTQVQPEQTPAKRDFRQEVTESIIKMLEEGVAPWQKPWKAGALELPFNPTTNHNYRGGNAIHLMAAGAWSGHDDPRWMTYKQAQENGWQVRQGEKGTQIEYWQFPDRAAAEQSDASERTNPTPMRRVYTVFNAKQIDGVPEYEPQQRQEWEVVESGEAILQHSGVKINHDQDDRAFYSRSNDEIHLPAKSAFGTEADYYGTALHELAHASGHPTRLNRPTLNESYRFGDPNYAKEELRAELTSVFLAAERGIPHNPEQHAAYVGAWIEALRSDKNEIFRAAKDAHQAADFLIAMERERSPEKALEAAQRRSETPRRETSEWAAQYEPGSQTVDVTHKESATEQERTVAGQTSTRSVPTAADLQRSFESAQSLAYEKLGGGARTYLAQSDSGHYRGTIIGETEHHYLQQLNSKSTAAHPKHFFAEAPAIGQSVRITYSNHLAAVSPFQQKAKSHELAR